MLISRANLPPKTIEYQITLSKYTSSTPTSIVRKFIGVFELWRRGWDSNPRYGFPYARFRGEYFQPLSHLSAVNESRLTDESAKRQRRPGSGCSAKQTPEECKTQRRTVKNFCKSAAHSCNRIPEVMSTR